MIYTSYKTDATNISVTGLQQFGSVSGLVPYACDEISSLRMFLVCPDVRRLSGSSRFPHYWQGPLGNVWQVYLYRNAKCRRIWIKTVLTLCRTIRLSICNPVYKPGTLKNKIGKINTITYDNRTWQATLFYKWGNFMSLKLIFIEYSNIINYLKCTTG